MFASKSRSESDMKKYAEKASALMNFSGKYYIIRTIEDLESLKSEIQKLNFIPAVVLSGGTSSLLMRLSDFRKTVILITLSGNNSLTSGLKARDVLVSKGINVIHFHDKEAKDLAKKLEAVEKIIESLKKSRILLAGIDESHFKKYEIDIEFLKKKFGVNIILSSLEELVNVYEKSKPHEKVLEKFSGKIKKSLDDPAKVRTALETLMKKYSATDVGIRCFPFILRTKVTPCLALSSMLDEGIIAGCEADIQAIIIMKIYQALGQISYIGNVVDYDEESIILAHCTVATKLVRQYELMPHFETGNDIAIRGEFFEGEKVTLAMISNDFRRIIAFEGIIDKVDWRDNICRSQVKIRIRDAKKVVNKLFAGHLVLAYGSWKEYFKLLSSMLNLKFIDVP
mgnify:CR=1 FL=1